MGSFEPSSPYRNVLLVGPSGSLGSVLLNSLASEPTFSLSVLVRESSKSTSLLPVNRLANVFKISDDYPYNKILEAFHGQDVVVNAITSTQVEQQFRFIDAAVEARVMRYVPSEYGLNNMRSEARALNSVFDGKARVQEYLNSKESTGLTWNAIACGMWIDWSLKNSFLGLDYANRTMTLTDAGHGRFSTSTMHNTALALNRALLAPESSKNKCVFVSDFATSQRELVDMIQRISGEEWTVRAIDSFKAIEEAQARIDAGDHMAVYKLIELGFVTGRYGGWLEEKEELWNERLALPRVEMEDVIREALAKMEA